MLVSYLVGLTVIAAVLALWVGVQEAWGRVFPGGEPDVLARRRGCRESSCTKVCDRRGNEPQIVAGAVREET